MRNQLTRSQPFVDNDNDVNGTELKVSNEDEGVLLASHDNIAHSSASSTVSSEEFEQSSTSSNTASFDTIKEELKHHYFGLLGSLDSLTNMANRVTERYRDESALKN
jgi:hypothetical protein